MKPKLNPDILLLAAEIQDDGYGSTFSCCNINCATEKITGIYTNYAPERTFYEELFGLAHNPWWKRNFLFDYMYRDSFGCPASQKELNEIRVLALCLAAEIARLKRNKKAAL